MVVRSLPMKSRIKLVRDVFDTFAAYIVYDVTDPDSEHKIGSTHSSNGDF